MNRFKVCENLNGLSANLLNVHSGLNQQIRNESAAVTEAKSALINMKKSVDNLRRRRDEIRVAIRGFTEVRNDLGYVTGVRVEVPSFSSSSNEGDSSDEVWLKRL